MLDPHNPEHLEGLESFDQTSVEPSEDDRPSIEELSIFQKIGRIIHEGYKDIKKGRLSGRIAVGATVLLYGYEIGPGGNETVAPLVMSEVARHTTDIPHGTPLVMAATGGFILAEQLFSGFLTRKSVKSLPRLAETTYEVLNSTAGKELEKGEQGNEATVSRTSFFELPNGKKLQYSFIGGSGYNVMREALGVGELDDEHLTKVSRVSSLLTASTVSVVAGTIDVLDKTVGQESVAGYATGALKNPLFWIAIFGAKFTKDVIQDRLLRRRKSAATVTIPEAA